MSAMPTFHCSYRQTLGKSVKGNDIKRWGMHWCFFNYLKKVHGIVVPVFGLILPSMSDFDQDRWFMFLEFLCTPWPACYSLLQLKLNLTCWMILFPILVFFPNQLKKALEWYCESKEWYNYGLVYLFPWWHPLSDHESQSPATGAMKTALEVAVIHALKFAAAPPSFDHTKQGKLLRWNNSKLRLGWEDSISDLECIRKALLGAALSNNHFIVGCLFFRCYPGTVLCMHWHLFEEHFTGRHPVDSRHNKLGIF